MFSVDSTVKLNFGKLDALSDNAVTALEMTADALLSELKNAQVMPKDTGNLQNENTFVDDSQSQRGVVILSSSTPYQRGVVILSSSTPYARRLYYHPEYHFNRSDNAMAQGEWLRFWLPGGTRQNFCQEKFKEIYKELCGL